MPHPLVCPPQNTEQCISQQPGSPSAEGCDTSGRPSFSGFPYYVVLIISFMREDLLQVSFCLPASKAEGWASDSKHFLDPGGPEYPTSCLLSARVPFSLTLVCTCSLLMGNGVKCTNTGWEQCNSSVTAWRCPLPRDPLYQGKLLGPFEESSMEESGDCKKLSLSSCLHQAEHMDLQGTICISEQGAWCTTQGLVPGITL